ncbi:hypothetical protein NFI96_009648 [Prochilodus magdalenae]|nr:hypothetical protein NFI96_009648 [Prochilodus magdalenae]
MLATFEGSESLSNSNLCPRPRPTSDINNSSSPSPAHSKVQRSVSATQKQQRRVYSTNENLSQCSRGQNLDLKVPDMSIQLDVDHDCGLLRCPTMTERGQRMLRVIGHRGHQLPTESITTDLQPSCVLQISSGTVCRASWNGFPWRAAAPKPYITKRSAERGTQWCRAPPLDSRAVEACSHTCHSGSYGFDGRRANTLGSVVNVRLDQIRCSDPHIVISVTAPPAPVSGRYPVTLICRL